MEIQTIIWIGAGLVGAGLIYKISKGYISIYNKFVYWKNKVEGKFANIDIIMQQRLDMLHALAQVAKKYSIHEYKTIKDTIEARSRWSKDKSANAKVKAVNEIENNFFKLQAVFEKYPKVRADKIYQQIMGRGNISRVESKLKQYRVEYNRAVRYYNERVQRFPRNIVARIHGFKIREYLNFKENKESSKYEAKEIFGD
jgi:LemA protein